MTKQYKDWCEKVIIDNDVKGGYPVFPGSRVTLQQVANLAKQGVTYSYLFSEFPFLSTNDIRYAVIYCNKFNEKNLQLFLRAEIDDNFYITFSK